MQSILRWSIEHSSPADSGPTDNPPRRDLDPGVLDFILGKPDSEQMKEDMAVATDVHRSEDERVAALDHLEMVSCNYDKIRRMTLTSNALLL
jgi:hsp70-interacting protein